MRLVIFLIALWLVPAPGWSEGEPLKKGRELFELNCGACHGLELPRSQHLDRANWEWVISDMVNKFGADWITPEQQGLILDYLVEAHGPKK